MSVPKQQFQIGDIAYMIDADFSWFDESIIEISLVRKTNEICYLTNSGTEFYDKDVDVWVFKSESEREENQLNAILREDI